MFILSSSSSTLPSAPPFSSTTSIFLSLSRVSLPPSSSSLKLLPLSLQFGPPKLASSCSLRFSASRAMAELVQDKESAQSAATAAAASSGYERRNEPVHSRKFLDVRSEEGMPSSPFFFFLFLFVVVRWHSWDGDLFAGLGWVVLFCFVCLFLPSFLALPAFC